MIVLAPILNVYWMTASVVKLSADQIYNSRAACTYHNVPQDLENTDPTYKLSKYWKIIIEQNIANVIHFPHTQWQGVTKCDKVREWANDHLVPQFIALTSDTVAHSKLFFYIVGLEIFAFMKCSWFSRSGSIFICEILILHVSKDSPNPRIFNSRNIHITHQIAKSRKCSTTKFPVLRYANYRNLVIFRVENISYVILSCSFNFVHSPYRIWNTCDSFIVEKYSCV